MFCPIKSHFTLRCGKGRRGNRVQDVSVGCVSLTGGAGVNYEPAPDQIKTTEQDKWVYTHVSVCTHTLINFSLFFLDPRQQYVDVQEDARNPELCDN